VAPGSPRARAAPRNSPTSQRRYARARSGLCSITEDLDSTRQGGEQLLDAITAVAKLQSATARCAAAARKGGRPALHDEHAHAAIRAMRDAGQHTIDQIAGEHGVSRPTRVPLAATHPPVSERVMTRNDKRRNPSHEATCSQSAASCRTLPDVAPTGFVPARWRAHVIGEDGRPDRRRWDLCLLSELHTALRSGAVWVQGSRR
jgi:hypothetical protein